jgi:serine/threonine-protein kinase
MSPEQAQGKTLTPASDIYSLATILYEVVTGKLPFDAKTPMDFLQLHVNGTPIGLNARVPGRTFSPLLEAVLDRALSKKPELRFATAKDFGEALAAVHAGKSNLPAHLGPVYGVATSDIAHLPTHKAAGVGIAGSPTPSDPAHLRQGSGRPGGSSARPSPGDGTSSRPQSRGGSGGEAIAAPRGSDQGSSSAVVAPARLGTGALVGIALAFMTLGVVIAVVVMQFVQR